MWASLIDPTDVYLDHAYLNEVNPGQPTVSLRNKRNHSNNNSLTRSKNSNKVQAKACTFGSQLTWFPINCWSCSKGCSFTPQLWHSTGGTAFASNLPEKSPLSYQEDKSHEQLFLKFLNLSSECMGHGPRRPNHPISFIGDMMSWPALLCTHIYKWACTHTDQWGRCKYPPSHGSIPYKRKLQTRIFRKQLCLIRILTESFQKLITSSKNQLLHGFSDRKNRILSFLAV